jgi:XTP/dITP diphosphohydrolase
VTPFAGAPRPSLVLASRNPGKAAEFRRLLAGTPWSVLSLDDAGMRADLAEPGPAYEDNARAKAEAVTAATGLPALGDDSGIEIPALDDWPGPLSARWMGAGAADRDRLDGLLREVERAGGDRRCRYVAVVAFSRPGLPTTVARGVCDGVLVAPAGDRGFGYDPAFLSDDLGTTFGVAPTAEKDRVSHRGRAMLRLTGFGVLGVPSAAP